MNNRDRLILEKIIDYCGQIESACDMFSNAEEAFTQGSVYQNACCMCILQIGELAGKLSEEAQKEVQGVPWREIRAMRNICAHNYGNIDRDTVWETVQNDIPSLKRSCAEALS